MQDSAQLESSDSGSEISNRNCKALLDVIELTLDGVGESMWHVVTLFVVSKSHGGFPFFQIVGGNTPVYRLDFAVEDIFFLFQNLCRLFSLFSCDPSALNFVWVIKTGEILFCVALLLLLVSRLLNEGVRYTQVSVDISTTAMQSYPVLVHKRDPRVMLSRLINR